MTQFMLVIIIVINLLLIRIGLKLQKTVPVNVIPRWMLNTLFCTCSLTAIGAILYLIVLI